MLGKAGSSTSLIISEGLPIISVGRTFFLFAEAGLDWLQHSAGQLPEGLNEKLLLLGLR